MRYHEAGCKLPRARGRFEAFAATQEILPDTIPDCGRPRRGHCRRSRGRAATLPPARATLRAGFAVQHSVSTLEAVDLVRFERRALHSRIVPLGRTPGRRLSKQRKAGKA